MTYSEAIEALRGHKDWWWYEYYGRTNEQVQQQAIEAAKEWLVNRHLVEASQQDPNVVRPCLPCP